MVNNKEKKVLIVGAGLGGLSTGVYAQLNGYQAHIYEQHTKSGGLAATWKRKGYLIDGGIHFLSGHKPNINLYKILQELGAANYNYIDMETYGRFHDLKTGFKIDITNNLEKLESDLLTAFPEDTSVINDLMRGTRALSKIDLSIFGYEKPGELYGLKDKIKDFWIAKGIWKYFTGKYNRSIREYTQKLHSPILTDFLMKVFLPDVPTWFIMMILAMIGTNQMCLLGDGSNEFAKCIERRFLSLGGEITYSNGVKTIIVEEGVAKGIVLDNGEKIFADYVISTVDGHHTIYDLLGGRFINDEIHHRYQNLKTVPPLFVATFGVTREFLEEPWLIITNLEEPLVLGNCTIKEITYRIFNYSNKFAPAGKTVVQVMIEANWDFWEKLHNNETQYKKEKEAIVEKILSEMEEIFPHISQSVEMTDIVTPYTYFRYTRSHKGSIMGFMPEASTMMDIWDKSLPGLQNFYHAGQYSFSIGGVLAAIISGRHVIQLMCHKERKKFKRN